MTTYKITGWTGSPATQYKIFEPPQGSTIYVTPSFLKKLILDPNLTILYNRESDKKLIWKWLNIDDSMFYTPADPINYTPADPINYTPADPINYTPAAPTNNTANNAYQVEIIFSNPLDYLQIPFAIEEKLYSLLPKFGWHFSAMYVAGGKLYIDLEKSGSIGAGALILIIAAVIAGLAAMYIQSMNIRHLATAASETIQSNNIKGSVSKVIDYCNQYGVSAEDCNALINGIQQTYSSVEVQQPGNNNNTAAGLGGGAIVLGLIALAALSKK